MVQTEGSEGELGMYKGMLKVGGSGRCFFYRFCSVSLTPPLSSMDSSNSEIAAFYNGKTIFLTGATGFVGKVLLAHLLAIAPNFRKIFLLVRPLKGVAASVRLEKDVLWAPFFKDMFARDPSLKEKLHVRPFKYWYLFLGFLVIFGCLCRN